MNNTKTKMVMTDQNYYQKHLS